MKVFIVISCTRSRLGYLNFNEIVCVFQTKKQADEFCELKNKRASYLRYIVNSKIMKEAK